jgi:hypothetical protein
MLLRMYLPDIEVLNGASTNFIDEGRAETMKHTGCVHMDPSTVTDPHSAQRPGKTRYTLLWAGLPTRST